MRGTSATQDFVNANVIQQVATGGGPTGVTAGTYGDGTHVPQLTVGSDERLRVVANVTITGAAPTGSAGGELTGTFPNPTLVASGVTAGTKGSASRSAVITVDAKGRVTNLTDAAIAGAGIDSSALHSGDAAGGDLTGTFPNPTLGTSGVSAATYGSATQVAQVAFDAKGRATSASNVAIAIPESAVTNLVTDLAAKASSTLTSAHLFVGNGSNVATDVAVTGDVTINNAGVTAIGSLKVTNAMLAGSIDLTSKVTGILPIGNLDTGVAASKVVLGGVITGAGPTGDASHTLALTYNAAGQLTAVTNNAIAIAESQVTNLTTDLAAKQSTTLTSAHILVGNGSNVATDVALSGDATLANTGAVTLAASGVTATTYGSASLVPVITVDAKGRITSATTAAIAGGPPSGAAGGVLAGTYPNPTLAAAVSGTDITLSGNLVAGAVSAPGGAISGGSLTTTGTGTFGGLLTGSLGMSITGSSLLTGALHVTGATTLDSGVAITGNVTVASGTVQIGTTSVTGGTVNVAGAITVENPFLGLSFISTQWSNGTSAVQNALDMRGSRGTGLGAYGALQSGDKPGSIHIGIDDGVALRDVAMIQYKMTENAVATTNYGGKWEVYTQPNASGLTATGVLAATFDQDGSFTAVGKASAIPGGSLLSLASGTNLVTAAFNVVALQATGSQGPSFNLWQATTTTGKSAIGSILGEIGFSGTTDAGATASFKSAKLQVVAEEAFDTATGAGGYRFFTGAAGQTAAALTMALDRNGKLWGGSPVTITSSVPSAGNWSITAAGGAVFGTLAAAATTIVGTLAVTSDFAINTNKLTVTASSGNTAIAGTLGVLGIASFGSTAQLTISAAGVVSTSGSITTTSTLTAGTAAAFTVAAAGAVTTAASVNIGTALRITRQTITLSNGANNNIAATTSFVEIVGPTGAFSISGFTFAGTTPTDGTTLVVVNTTTQAMTITDDATSTAANRLKTNTGADVVQTGAGGSTAYFIYNGGESRWRLVAGLA